jgi:hypothetical protein
MALGCGDGSGPSDVAGTYVLTRVNQAPPPALVQATVHCDVFLDAAVAELERHGAFSLTFQQTTDCSRAGGGRTIDHFTVTGTYAVSGTQITFSGPGLLPLTATIAGEQISTTIPASAWTFPIPLAVVFARSS